MVPGRPTVAGEESLRRVARLVAGLDGDLGRAARELLARHGYAVDDEGGGPHRNVLGHPLFELPVWVDHATNGAGHLDADALSAICDSALCGYLSVRAEDDYLDGDHDDAGETMMLAGLFRARHQALLAPLVHHAGFWARFEEVWRGYAGAMLLERDLHRAESTYEAEHFDRVLSRSQPLELPAAAVLAMKGRWDRAQSLAAMVRHLTRATQLFDDFVDAPDDLAAGNFTWMVRRLGGLEGEAALRRGMVAGFDRVVAEAAAELEEARGIAGELGIVGLGEWAADRIEVMSRASERMYQTLFSALGRRPDRAPA